jgi:hypothetical protein
MRPTSRTWEEPRLALRLRVGGELTVIAATLERPVIEKTLKHLGLELWPLPLAVAREPGAHRAA